MLCRALEGNGLATEPTATSGICRLHSSAPGTRPYSHPISQKAQPSQGAGGPQSRRKAQKETHEGDNLHVIIHEGYWVLPAG